MGRKMKKVFIIIGIVVISVYSWGGTYFSVKSDKYVQNSEIGLKLGNLAISGGIDTLFFSINNKATNSTQIKEYTENNYGEYELDWSDSNEFEVITSGSARLFIPNVGLKLFLSNKRASPFVFGTIYKSFANIDYTLGSEGTSEELPDNIKDSIEDLLGFWGINIGLGGEYKVNDSFSIVAEHGFRLILSTTVSKEEKRTSYESHYYGNKIKEEINKWENSLKGKFGFTYTNIGVSFNF